MEETGVSHDRVNVNGGAIAMGHPIGATGNIMIGTLVDELERTGAKRGVATLCVGLGMGVATLIERVWRAQHDPAGGSRRRHRALSSSTARGR